jgi:hypothetical protein
MSCKTTLEVNIKMQSIHRTASQDIGSFTPVEKHLEFKNDTAFRARFYVIAAYTEDKMGPSGGTRGYERNS